MLILLGLGWYLLTMTIVGIVLFFATIRKGKNGKFGVKKNSLNWRLVSMEGIDFLPINPFDTYDTCSYLESSVYFWALGWLFALFSAVLIVMTGLIVALVASIQWFSGYRPYNFLSERKPVDDFYQLRPYKIALYNWNALEEKRYRFAPWEVTLIPIITIGAVLQVVQYPVASLYLVGAVAVVTVFIAVFTKISGPAGEIVKSIRNKYCFPLEEIDE